MFYCFWGFRIWIRFLFKHQNFTPTVIPNSLFRHHHHHGETNGTVSQLVWRWELHLVRIKKKYEHPGLCPNLVRVLFLWLWSQQWCHRHWWWLAYNTNQKTDTWEVLSSDKLQRPCCQQHSRAYFLFSFGLFSPAPVGIYIFYMVL